MAGLLEIFISILCIDYGNSVPNIVTLALVVFFAIIMMSSIWLDIQMMSFNRSLTLRAKKNLERFKTKLTYKPLVIRVDSEEYNVMVIGKKKGGMENFIEDHDRPFVDYKDNLVLSENIIFSDSYLKNNYTSRTTSMFYFIHGYDDNVLYNKSKNIRDSLNLVRKYRVNRWSIIGYCDIHDEFEVYDVLHVFDNIEQILCRICGTSGRVLEKSDHNNLSSALSHGASFRVEAGMVDDIVELYFMIREYRDNYMVRFEDDYNSVSPSFKKFLDLPVVYVGDKECVGLVNYRTHDPNDKQPKSNEDSRRLMYLEAVSPFVFLLRYVLSKKLSNMDISQLNLENYDFSYGIMNDIACRDSMLKNVLFYNTLLSSADFTNSNMSASIFRYCDCTGITFIGANMSNVVFDKTLFQSALFDRSLLSSVVCPEINFHNSSFVESSIFESDFNNCRITNSSFDRAQLTSSSMDDCLLSNSSMSNAIISETSFNKCDFSGCVMPELTVTTSYLRDCDFTKGMMSRSGLMSDILIMCDFSNSQCDSVNFTGSQLLDVVFDSAIISNSNFTRVYLGPYGLEPSNEIWTRRDQKLCDEYNDVRQKLRNLIGIIDVSGQLDNTPNLQDRLYSRISSFSNTLAEKCVFSDAEISLSRFYGTIFNGSNFTNSAILKCTFENASFSEGQFTDVKLSECNFTNASFNHTLVANSLFDSSQIRDASFIGSSIIQTTFLNCDLQSTAFSGSTITNCSFINVENISSTILNSELSELVLENCTIDGYHISGIFSNVQSLVKHINTLKEKVRKG